MARPLQPKQFFADINAKIKAQEAKNVLLTVVLTLHNHKSGDIIRLTSS